MRSTVQGDVEAHWTDQQFVLGIVFEIEPWNMPFFQVVRPLAPQLMAGNVVVLELASVFFERLVRRGYLLSLAFRVSPSPLEWGSALDKIPEPAAFSARLSLPATFGILLLSVIGLSAVLQLLDQRRSWRR